MSYASVWAKNNITKPNAKLYLEKFGHLLKWQNYKENIMDAGCGDGCVTSEVLYPYVRKHAQKILAVDKLDGMIDYANKHNKIDEIDYQLVDVTDQNKTKGLANQFRHIFAFHLAQWIPDTKTLLTGFHKMLKPNENIYLSNNIGFELNLCDYEKRTYTIENFGEFLRAGLVMYEHLERIPKELQDVAG
ncbi:Methyltransferase domain [Popillia japonica]|uniref:Methyltransferase domain n=1 Tax=Popillia japonica TaxID=7064 RepID=A0AAW1KGH8_POPJA